MLYKELTLNGDHCPACGSADIHEIDAVASDRPEADFHLIECRSCGVAWQWPLLRSAAVSADVQRNAYRASTGYYDSAALQGRIEVQCDVLDSLRRPGTLLDIGGGSGALIRAAARRGWDCVGVDPAATPFSEPNARMIEGTLSQIGRTFDAVTLFDVVEHIEDYLVILKDAYDALDSGGSILVETGNYQSLDRIRGGREWWDYNVEHRWYLNPPLLMRQMEEIGYRNVRLLPTVARPGWKREAHQPIRLSSAFKLSVKRLSSFPFRQWRQERLAADKWPDCHYLPIFLVAAERA